MIAPWLLRHVAATSGTPDDRYARPQKCFRCSAAILAGLDADVGAFLVRVDPDALGTLGEALALLSGRRTCSLLRQRRHWLLRRRDRWQVAGEPAGTPRRFGPADVVAEHRCHTAPLPSIPTSFPKPTKGAANERCPF